MDLQLGRGLPPGDDVRVRRAGCPPTVATIGIEDILGQSPPRRSAPSDPSAVLEEGGTICLDYEGIPFDTVTLGYSATVDTGVLPGTYTNSAVHITDDPFAQPVIASDSVEVGRVCTLTITQTISGPLTVESGTTCVDRAIVIGKVTVKQGAALVVNGSIVIGPLTGASPA